MALLEVADLEARYGWTKVLHGIRFAVEDGGITTILGANGAGKTTTLRAVCGMVRTAGEIRFDGARIAGRATEDIVRDRKSTRLNSSHSQISYAVFCLKKKKKNKIHRYD